MRTTQSRQVWTRGWWPGPSADPRTELKECPRNLLCFHFPVTLLLPQLARHSLMQPLLLALVWLRVASLREGVALAQLGYLDSHPQQRPTVFCGYTTRKAPKGWASPHGIDTTHLRWLELPERSPMSSGVRQPLRNGNVWIRG